MSDENNNPAENPEFSSFLTSRSKELYESFFVNNYSVMLLIDPVTGQIIDANDKAVEYYGFTRDTLLSMNISEINILDNVNVSSEMKMAREKKQNHFNFRHKLANGEIRDVEVFSGPISINDKEFLFSLIYDVTSTKLIQKALNESEEKYRRLVELSPDTIFVQSDGKFVLINPAGVKIFGAENPEDILGKYVVDFVHPDFRNTAIERIRTINDAKQFAPLREIKFLKINGSAFMAEVSGTPIEYNGMSGALVMARDITKRKEIEDEIKRSNRELEQFAYIASHDLQEPLRMVASFTKLLSRKYKDKLDKDADEYIDYIVDGTRRMQTLINDLLSYARISAKPVALSPTDLNEILLSILRDLQITIAESATKVEFDYLPTIMAEPGQMKQLFQNLIQNAIKFRSECNSFVQITAKNNNRNWTFCVRDNGIGIDPKFHEKIFVIFERIEQHRNYAGTGIGLSICKRIVERHKGNIWVESEPGKGSAFYFTIPSE
jgi:PAS domain S-box-containing protein